MEVKMSFSLEGKIAVITGGTAGIGSAIAKEFAEHGATVVITGRDQGRLDEAVAKIGPNASGARADAGNPAAMDKLLKDVKARHGRLDALVANAVVDDHAPLGKITEEQFDKMIGTNLKGVLFAVQSAAPLMSNGSSIILIGSTASVAPPPGMSIYGAIKGGFHGMIRALVQDLKGTGVRINILSPGAVDTPSLRRALGKAAGAGRVDEIVQSMAQRSPVGRIGEAHEIGKVAVFLASDASSYVNGVELFVDGGLTQVT
jgi:NAD(P)-dependent dehydrogenase (short-subunit alcohol dehydrogenase family)